MKIRKNRLTLATIVAAACMLAPAAMAASETLEAIDFPEGKSLDVSFQALRGAPQAKITGKVGFEQGQASIELKHESMKPAILYGGDVTCYVLWAVTRDGNASNLGEFIADRPKGEATYSSRQKKFAMMITAEPYYLVRQPSELVVFKSNPSEHKKYPSVPFDFDGFVEAPHHAMDDIAAIAWDSTVPLVLLQARKAFELADRDEAEQYAVRLLRRGPRIAGQRQRALREVTEERQVPRRRPSFGGPEQRGDQHQQGAPGERASSRRTWLAGAPRWPRSRRWRWRPRPAPTRRGRKPTDSPSRRRCSPRRPPACRSRRRPCAGNCKVRFPRSPRRRTPPAATWSTCPTSSSASTRPTSSRNSTWCWPSWPGS